MVNKLEDLTILVNSCDSYEDLWDPFFKLFKKYGGELTKCPIILNTESKKFTYNGLNIICPNDFKSPVEWGRRLRHTLNKINTEFVLFLLDDFFLQKNVNTESFIHCLSWLKQNKNIGSFNLIPIEPAQNLSSISNDFCEMPVNMKYRFNAQASIWKKTILYNSILDIESPWEWEIYGNLRNKILMKDVELFALKYGSPEPYNYGFVDYNKSNKDNIIAHSAIMRGKWDLSCIEQCFKENNINIDYSVRGIYTPDSQKKKKPFIYRCLRKFYLIFFNFKNKAAEKRKRKLLVDIPIKEFRRNIEAKNEK